MLGNRRNLVFRVSIVINLCVLLYAAVHLSGGPTAGGEWVVSVSGEGGSSETRSMPYVQYESTNETVVLETAGAYHRNYDETTSPKTPSTVPFANHTASSTVQTTESERRYMFPYMVDPSTAVRQARLASYETSYEQDETKLTQTTLKRLKSILQCNDKDYITEYVQRGDFWVLKNYVQAEHGPVQCHESITYTTHGGFEFLDNVKPLVERWMAPISLAVHAPGTDYEPTVNSIRYLRDCIGTNLIREFVTFHIYFASKHVPSKILNPKDFLSKSYDCSLPPPYNVNASTTYMKQKDLLYPVNVGRNIARDAAMTHFILMSDIELYPSPDLIPKFLNMIARNKKPLKDSTKPRVFPISLFEVDAHVGVPSSKTELQKMLANKTAIPFHKNVCSGCHKIPQGQQWTTAKETQQMDIFHVGKRQGTHVHWEPVFISTHHEPYFDERLSWEGKQDKMTQGYVLCVKDYEFMILNNAFLVHKPGIKKYKKDKKRDTIAGRQSAFIKSRIMPELRTVFGTRAGCAL